MVDVSLRFATVQWLDKITNIFLLPNKWFFSLSLVLMVLLTKITKQFKKPSPKHLPFLNISTHPPLTHLPTQKNQSNHHEEVSGHSHLMTWPFITMRRKSPIHDNVLNAGWSINQRVLLCFRPLTNGNNLATRKSIRYVLSSHISILYGCFQK